MSESKNCVRPLVLVCILVLTALHALASDEDLANERFVEPGKAIEVHWQIDCKKTSAAVSILLAKLADKQQVDCGSIANAVPQNELNNLLDSLQKCGFIYNARGSRRFQPCPDYALAHSSLGSAADASRHTAGSRSQLIRQAQVALNCKLER